MRRYDYPQSFAAGVIAAGGTLGAIFPPSTVLAVYGLITQQDIGKLFIAGILPGVLAVSMYMLTIAAIGLARPGFLPAGPRSNWSERLRRCATSGLSLLLFVFVIGGLYGGLFTPTEAGGVGACGAFLISVARGQLKPARRSRGAAAGDAHRGRGVHRPDRRACCSAISSPSRRSRRR